MRIALLAAIVSVAACTGGSNPYTPPADAGSGDAGGVDAGTTDAGATDGGADAGTVNPNITISNFTFTPINVTVSPGGTITIHNGDAFAHTFTSQAVIDAFTPGGVNGVLFDSGTIGGGGTATITIPSVAVSGTVIPFYCAIHGSMMGSGTVSIQ